MPGGNICEENLEQRIERIRKRDEEIEKRHREAEADRLAALQANAMVKTKPPNDEDWPKAHKYDKLDFTYDVKNDNIDEAAAKKSTEDMATRLQRPFKKFPDGQGPPSDPTYNFLADAERDGISRTTTASSSSDNDKNWRANNNNNNSNFTTNNSNRRNSNNNSSFNRGKNGAKGKNAPAKGKSDERWSDESRSNYNKQKSIEGKWRRDSDSDKPKVGLDERLAKHKSDIGAKAQPTQRSPEKKKIEANNLPQKLSELAIEKRGNITVSVTKDGEVKSVRCKLVGIFLKKLDSKHNWFLFSLFSVESARAIGTGRVGGGNIRQNIPVTQYSPNPIMPEPNVSMNAISHAADYGQFILPPQMPPQVQPQIQLQQQPQVVQAPISTPIQETMAPKPSINMVNGVPFKLPSVQDRLTRNRIYFDEKLKNTDNPVAINTQAMANHP